MADNSDEEYIDYMQERERWLLEENERLRAENEKLREALKTVCRGVVSERESLDWFIMDGAALRVARDAIRENGE